MSPYMPLLSYVNRNLKNLNHCTNGTKLAVLLKNYIIQDNRKTIIFQTNEKHYINEAQEKEATPLLYIFQVGYGGKKRASCSKKCYDYRRCRNLTIITFEGINKAAHHL